MESKMNVYAVIDMQKHQAFVLKNTLDVKHKVNI
ncbi:hypothetical protein ABH968_001595 [Lysinibacillus sp. RC79]